MSAKEPLMFLINHLNQLIGQIKSSHQLKIRVYAGLAGLFLHVELLRDFAL